MVERLLDLIEGLKHSNGFDSGGDMRFDMGGNRGMLVGMSIVVCRMMRENCVMMDKSSRANDNNGYKTSRSQWKRQLR